MLQGKAADCVVGRGRARMDLIECALRYAAPHPGGLQTSVGGGGGVTASNMRPSPCQRASRESCYQYSPRMDGRHVVF